MTTSAPAGRRGALRGWTWRGGRKHAPAASAAPATALRTEYDRGVHALAHGSTLAAAPAPHAARRGASAQHDADCRDPEKASVRTGDGVGWAAVQSERYARERS